MSVCIVSHDGALLVHRHMPAAPAPFLQAVTPYREGRVVAVECLCTWSWLADLCAAQAIPWVLGHALSMQAIPGGQATNDTSDAPKLAAVLRGGMLPPASVSPADRRSTRDRVRRRTPLMRQRAALLAHVHKPHAPSNWPDIGKQIAAQAPREGVAERLHDPAVHKPIEVDLARMTSDDALLRDLELSRVQTAQQPAAHTLAVLQTVPGIGNILRLVQLDDIPAIGRLPRVQALAAYARLGQCSTASAGKRVGPSGKQSGHAHLTWALSAAAPWFLRNHPTGQTLLTHGEKKHGTGKALTIRAHTLARAVYDMLKRTTAVAMEHCLRTARSRTGAPGASLDPHGMSRQSARAKPWSAASGNAQVCLGRLSRSPGPCWDARLGSGSDDESRPRLRWAAPPPTLALTGERDRSAMLLQRTG
ncbi:MAG TPA: transposase [Candidatus Tectomicrobia bacterium]|nr:transposase [Candidatus Tectomicrobia bacterium]